MCLSPVRIKNPRFIDLGYTGSEDGSYDHLPDISECRFKTSWHMLKSMIATGETYIQNVSQRYVEVPCGHCAECIAKKQNSLAQRAYFESLGKHCYFATLTYNDEFLPRFTDRYGREWTYANLSDLQRCLKDVRKHFFDKRGVAFKYIAVSERGSKKHRPHFHVEFFCESENISQPRKFAVELGEALKKYWSVRIGGTHRNPVYKQRFDDVSSVDKRGRKVSSFDCHYIEPFFGQGNTCKDGQSVTWYVCKYMVKADPYEAKMCKRFLAPFYKNSRDDYESVPYGKKLWRVLSSHGVWSKHFGDTLLARDTVVKAYYDFLLAPKKDQHVPQFSVSAGLAKKKKFSVAQYYFDKYLSDDDKMSKFFYTANPRTDFDSSYSYEIEDPSELNKREYKGVCRLRHAQERYLFPDDDVVEVGRTSPDIVKEYVDTKTGEIAFVPILGSKTGRFWCNYLDSFEKVPKLAETDLEHKVIIDELGSQFVLESVDCNLYLPFKNFDYAFKQDSRRQRSRCAHRRDSWCERPQDENISVYEPVEQRI